MNRRIQIAHLKKNKNIALNLFSYVAQEFPSPIFMSLPLY